MIIFFLVLSGCFLAYANGANDNAKGVATILAGGIANYKTAINWATATTLAGSIASVFLAETLVRKFSGKGLVPDALVTSPSFMLSVAVGAACTVILATRFGFPISTTHGLIGGLIGAGLAGVGYDRISLASLGSNFLVPLLLSPVLAMALGCCLYGVFHSMRRFFDLKKEWCVCIGTEVHAVPMPGGAAFALRTPSLPALYIQNECSATCSERYCGAVFGIDAQRLVDGLHFLSSGVISFARGLNDTPKIAALFLLVGWLNVQVDIVFVGAAIAAGGLLGAYRVAETMSQKITSMNPGQAFVSNLATGILVTCASAQGLPVSTTHVAVGSIFGIGLLTGRTNYSTVSKIVSSWVITLPCAAVIAGIAYFAITSVL